MVRGGSLNLGTLRNQLGLAQTHPGNWNRGSAQAPRAETAMALRHDRAQSARDMRRLGCACLPRHRCYILIMLRRTNRAENHRSKQEHALPSATEAGERRQQARLRRAEAQRQAKLVGESRDSAEALDWIGRNGPLADPDE